MTGPDTRHFGSFSFEPCRLASMRWFLSAAATFSRHWSEQPDGCWFSRTPPDSNKQTIHLGYKERSARTRYRGNPCDPSIRRFFRFQNIKEASPATDVNARALGINEQVIGIAAGFGGRDRPAVRHGEDAELGTSPKDHEDLATNVVQGHREICTPIGQRPFSDLLLRNAVHDRDAASIGHVDEDLAVSGSIWKLSGCASSEMSPTLLRVEGSITASAPLPYPTKIRLAAASTRILSASLPSSIRPVVL